MNICLINPADFPRSEVFNLGYHLHEKGHDISIIYPTRGKILNANSADIKSISFPAYFVPKIHYTIPNFQKEYALISKLVKDEKCEIIQACDFDYLTSLPPVLIKKKTKTPFVLTTDAFPGISWFFGNNFVDTIAQVYTRTIGKFIIDSCDELIVLNNELSIDAINMGIHKEKTHVIPNGIDFEQFNPDVEDNGLKKELFIKNDEKVLLFVGRLSLVKRIDILIDVTEKLSRDGFKIKTIIVGDGEYKDYYKQLVKSLDNIIFINSVPNSDVPKFFGIADIFVLPSLSEGLPNVLLEASASGIPIVATKTGGIPDIVIHGKTGFLAESGNVQSFYNYIELLLNNDSLSQKFGKNAIKHVKNKFGWDVIIKKYETLYEKVINK